jgi:hypothetical protein
VRARTRKCARCIENGCECVCCVYAVCCGACVGGWEYCATSSPSIVPPPHLPLCHLLTFHCTTFSPSRYTAEQLGPGAVLVLRQVSVFSPNPRSHYLNLTPDNIVHLFTANCLPTQPPPAKPRISAVAVAVAASGPARPTQVCDLLCFPQLHPTVLLFGPPLLLPKGSCCLSQGLAICRVDEKGGPSACSLVAMLPLDWFAMLLLVWFGLLTF